MPGGTVRTGAGDDDEDKAEDGEWTDPLDRDPDRDRKITKKHVERAYRQANRHNAAKGKS